MPVRPVSRTLAALSALAVATAACSGDGGTPPSSGGQAFPSMRGTAPVAMQTDRDCDAVLEDFQSFAPAVLSDQLFGFDAVGQELEGGFASDGADMASGSAATADRAASPDAAAALSQADGDSSDTNTQEAGIDEPDVVENDGEFVYVVDHGPGRPELVILDGATAEVRSRTPLASSGAQILLAGDRVLAIGGGGSVHPMPVEDGAATTPAPFGAGTVLQLIDVSDRSATRVLQTTEVEGHHVATRVVDGVARIVVTSLPDAQPLFEDASLRLGGRGDRGPAQDALAAGIADTTIEDWLPAFRTTVPDDGAVASRTTTEGTVVACDDVFVPEVNAGIAQTSVLRVDFTDGFDPADTATVVAQAGTVYASASTLYVAANAFVPVGQQGRVAGEDFTTALHAFDLRGDGAATHVGAGEVPGHLLNQYSLSEHDGHLRVATTEGSPWGGGGEPSESGVRVLQLVGDRLVEVGAVTGLGVTETIQSVRFMGPVGYVVTFRQTDPLYVIDLSDPTAPAAVGELKIPGFSSYLHPVADGRLVGIGRDADLQGRDRGLLVSLFDVSDPTAPAQIQTWTERDAWSVAGHDPKAFLHWAPESAVVVPLERSGDGAVPRSGIAVLDVADTGIRERAFVTAEGRYPLRAVVVQGRLWSLFDGGVVVSDFDALTAGSFTSFR